tara:strand:- start:430 stop:1008 length:579 start_codon:yes stop_codon:yes gene_type:complete
MKKSNGLKKIKTAVFISGRGTNLKSLIKFSKKKNSPIIIEKIITNNIKSYGLNYARKYNIDKKIFNFKNKSIAEKKILKLLKINKISLICLAGFMKILSKKFLKSFSGKVINIHPSLLPKYKGLNTHERVIKNNEKYSGCTVHYVNEKLDSGKIIMQKRVKILKNDTIYSLKKRILKNEHRLYPAAIKKIFN